MSIIDAIANRLGYVRKTEPQVIVHERVELREYARLTQPMFDQFRRQVLAGNAVLTENTSELQAGHIIGVNHALNILRDGYVVEPTSAANPV